MCFKISTLIIALGIFSYSSNAQNLSDKPNIVVVLADDIGLGDISGYRRAHSNKILVETPQINQLMKAGISFTDAHSPTALCAPSRYSIMTGKNTYHSYRPWGVWGSYEQTAVKKTDLTLGKLMKSAGYNTAFLGKWHLGSDYKRKSTDQIYRGKGNKMELDIDVTKIVGNGPKQQGFDYSFMYPAGIQDVPYIALENEVWFPLTPKSEIGLITKKKMLKKKVTLDKKEGIGDTKWNPFNMGKLLAEKGVEYINNTPADKPFFMYYCSQAVHKPHTPAKKLNGKKIKGSTSVYHLDLIKELDVQMEMLVQALKKKGVYDNTIFIITSDNGGLAFSTTTKTGHRPSDIYSGAKNSIREGGHRVPFIVVWPSKIKANTQSKALISGTDILATLGAVVNAEIPEDQALDSANLLPILLGENEAKERNQLMIQSGTSREAAFRDGDWKLIIKFNKKEMSATGLYNLNKDPHEDKNLIENATYKSRVETMFATYSKIRTKKLPTRSI